MKKSVFLLAVVLVLAIFAGCGKNSATVTPLPKTLRLSEVHAKGYPTALADAEFAELVEEKTQGRIKIEVRTGGALAESETDAIKALQYGDLAFARVSAAPVATFVPKLNAIQLPYLYKSSSHMWNVLNSRIGQDMLSDIEKSNSGLVGLCYYDGGSRSFYTTMPVSRVSDLAGLRIRVQNNQMMVDMCTALGAQAVIGIGMAQVAGKITSGEIDGAENNWPTYQSVGDYKVAQYYVLDQHTRVPEILLASKKVLDKLSKEDMELIREAAKETQEYEIQKWQEKEQSSEQIVRANGNTITTLSSAAFREFQDAMQPLYAKYGSDYQSIITEIRNTN